MIINLHGFKSQGNNSKYKILLKHFDKELIYSPTLPVSPKETVELINNFLIKNQKYPNIFIGTSLGGFFAYYLFNKHDSPAHLINPSLKPWLNLSQQIGLHTRYDSNESFEWKSEYLQELIDLNSLICVKENLDINLNFYLGKNDEIINHDYLKTEFKNCSKIWTDDNHRFSEMNFEKYVIPKIKEQFR